MDADLDTLCTVIYCNADDFLPEVRKNARRRITDAEMVTLRVAQAIGAAPATASSSRSRASGSAISCWCCPVRPAISSVADAWRTRSSGSCPTSPVKARASAMSRCPATRPRPSAAAAVRPRSAQRSERSPATATARPLALVLGRASAPLGRSRRYPQSVHARRSAAR